MDKLEIIVKALDEKLGYDIVAIDMQQASPLFDAFVICSAKNERQLQAIKDEVEDKMNENGVDVKRIEGHKDSKWILMDYNDVVIHIFVADERVKYNLEKLWSDMPKINIEGMIK